MNKYAILTFHDAKNYGAALQMYALHKTIEKMGYTPEILRYYDKNYMGAKKGRGIADIYNILKANKFNMYPYLKTYNQSKQVKVKFSEFKEKYFNLSDRSYYNDQDLNESDQIYHGFIVGSDMVWSDIGQNLNVFFLNFTNPMKRISYAPSITGTEKFDTLMHQNMKKWIDGIRFLSCRELSGAKYISDLTHRKPQIVLDPTLLLKKGEWIKDLELNEKNEQDYILCYVFGGLSKKFKASLKKISKTKKLKIRFIPNHPQEYLEEMKNNSRPIYGPQEFAELFLNAKYIVTNTFHGLAFSIIFEKKFILLERSTKVKMANHGERLTNLLSICKIDDKFHTENNSLEELFKDVDYKNVSINLEKARQDSLKYLSESLKVVDTENFKYDRQE